MNAAQLRRLKLEALTDIWAFADLINFKGGRSSFSAFHYEYTDFLTAPQKHTNYRDFSDTARRLCLMPRGHLKSTLGSILWVLWRVYRNPDIRILYATSSQKLGRSFIRELRQYFEDPELQERVWNARPHIEGRLVPALDAASRRAKSQRRGSSRLKDDDEYDDDNMADDKKLIWSREALQVIRPGKFKEPTVWVVSTGTMSTGDHADALVLDDVVTFRNADSAPKRESIQEWTLDLASIVDPPRLVSHGQLTEMVGAEWVILGTRYFGGDLYETYLEDADALKLKTYIRNIYKNGVDDADGYLWHEKFTPEYVADLRAQTERAGRNRWASQYLNVVITEDDKLVKEGSIVFVHPSDIEKVGDGFVKIRVGDRRHLVKLLITCDPAASVSKKSDFSVICVGGYDEHKSLYVVDMRILKADMIKLTDELFNTVERWGVRRVFVEAVAYQQQLLTYIRDVSRKRGALVLNPYVPRTNKQERITAQLEPLLHSGMLHVATWINKLEEFKAEINYYPKSQHDDVLDCLAMLAELATRTQSPDTRSRGVCNKPTYNRMFGGIR
jgi:predicted phage terminase large subunit-like protein